MKNIIYISFLLGTLSIFGCKEDTTPTIPSTPNIEGTHLNIDVIKSYLPEALTSERSIRYISEAGETKELKAHYLEKETPRTLDGFSYSNDGFELTLYDESDPKFQAVLLGSANYNTTGDYALIKSLTVILMPANPTGGILDGIRFDDNGFKIMPYDDFHTTLVLNDKEFKDCFIMKDEHSSEYSEIYLNSEVGIVAFRGKDNVLFVFEEFFD